MPELPEVETIARTLAPCVVGKHINTIKVLNEGTWQGDITPEQVCQMPRLITGTGRRAKVLLLNFGHHPDRARQDIGAEIDQNSIQGLAFHLKMSGKVFAYPTGTAPGKHTRVIFGLGDGSLLFFDDTRKFGYVRALTPKSLQNWPFWQKLGPEPFSLDSRQFIQLFQPRKTAIKALLLDQEIIAGVGNIYADESLFRAGINPAAPGNSIPEAKLCLLHTTLQEVLQEAIDACGSSIRDYRDAKGDAGSFQNSFRVYGRAGQSCVVCKTPLSHARIAGRGTVFCNKCQNR